MIVSKNGKWYNASKEVKIPGIDNKSYGLYVAIIIK